jgi:uncharacterized protein
MREMRVFFPSGGVLLSGLLLRRDDDGARRPTAIVTGSWLTVKEQMPLTYARRLVDRGIDAFVFDFAGFGESGGEPRQLEMPSRKADDLAAAAQFLRTLSSHSGGIGLVAVCASAQYGLLAIARGARIDTFVSVAGWFHDAASVAPFYGGDAGVGTRLAAANAAAARYATSGIVETAPAYRAGDESAGMFFELDYYASPSRGAVPSWRNEMAVMSWSHWLTFDGLRSASDVRVPSLIIHSDDCALPQNARLVYDSLAGRKQLHWSSGGQTDFYDQPTQVDDASDRAAVHLETTLS